LRAACVAAPKDLPATTPLRQPAQESARKARHDPDWRYL
jgi:hypothetical protein